jgi:hypothetical protein
MTAGTAVNSAAPLLERGVKMRHLTSILMVLFVVGTLFGANSKEEATKRRKYLTTKLLINRIKESFPSRKVPEDLIVDEIEKNISAHSKTKASESLAKTFVYNHLDSLFSGEVERIIKANDPDGKYISTEERQNLRAAPATQINQAISNSFSGAFDKARKTVTERQVKKLKSHSYPTEEDVDSLSRSTLHKKLMDAIEADFPEPLLEETIKIFGVQFVDKIITDAYEQREFQSKIVKDSSGGNKVELNEIADAIDAELKRLYANLRKKKSNELVTSKVYGTFPSISSQVRSQADTLEKQKFMQFLNYVVYPVAVADLEDFIKDNASVCKTYKKSFNLAVRQFSSHIEGTAIGEHSQKAAKPAEFAKRLSVLFSGNATIRTLIQNVVARSVNKNLQQARNNVANWQVGEYFGPLVSGAWLPGDTELEKFDRFGSTKVTDPYSWSGISSKSYSKEELLEETDQKVTNAVSSVVDMMKRILARQESLVSSNSQAMSIEVKNGQKYQESELTISSIEAILKERVISEWNSDKESSKHPGLYPSVISDIAEKARTVVEVEVARREQVKRDEERRAREAAVAKERAEKEAQDRARREARRRAVEKARAEQEAANQAAEGDQGRRPGEASPSGESAGDQDIDTQGNGATGGEGGQGLPGSSPSESSTAGGGTPVLAMDELYSPDMLVDLDYEAGDVRLNVYFTGDRVPKGITKEYSCTIHSTKPMDVLIEIHELVTLIQVWFKGSVKNDERVNLFVAARIFDGRVTYGSVITIRKVIERVLEKLETKVDVLWYDDYYQKDEWKGKKYIPKEQKKRFRNLLT